MAEAGPEACVSVNSYLLGSFQLLAQEHLAVWKHGILELHPKLQNVQEFSTGFDKTATELQSYGRDNQLLKATLV